jgi:ABC-type Zn uptake system ZnuABC Zn-binding protein ZnuA
MLPTVAEVRLGPGEKLAVVASTSIVGDVVANIAGDAANLTVLIAIGQDPHGYEPTPSALVAVEQAHIVFVNGFGLEESLLDAVEATATGIVVPVSAGIEPLEAAGDHEEEGHDETEDHDHGAVDPHVWFDPTNVMVWAANIERVLSEADPRNRDGYHERADAYRDQLASLDAAMRREFASIPPERRTLVTDHRLFTYFADEYGFEVVGTILPGTSTAVESSARRIADLVELLREAGTATLYVGSTAGRGLVSVARSITEELGRQLRIVSVLTGSLTEPGTPGATYLGYMEYNTRQILDGLQPQADG